MRSTYSWLSIGVALLALSATGCRPLGIPAPNAPPPPGLAAEPSFRSSPGTEGWDSLEDDDHDDYDPWQSFNEPMFRFNHDVLDRFVLKPMATAWDTVLPDPAQRAIGRAFDNLDMPHRLVNNLLQARPFGAGQELARFALNTTVGAAGLFDVAKTLGIEKSDADTGQTLGVYGVGPGPYLVLPFLRPLTVRDGIGYGIDGLLDPLGYLLPGAASTARSVVNTVNDRSLNLAVFQDVEDRVVDLYSAVRNGYLQRRQRTIANRRGATQEGQPR